MNHDLRETQNELNLAQKRAYNKQQTQLAYDQLWDIEPQSPKECISDVCLKGPYRCVILFIQQNNFVLYQLQAAVTPV